VERAIAWFADHAPEQFPMDRMAEFAAEQCNPSNWKHVTRIVAELPSARLRDGVVYVDTPGLGSLATSGAAETLAYLPRCDLGVVLIDAASTLTADDLATIRALYDAAIPAMVVLSKSDLLAPGDQERTVRYIADQIGSELGLHLPVHAVSAKPDHAELLEYWFTTQILPLYDRHADLARESLSRKIGALRAGVEAALRSRVSHLEPGGEAGDLQIRQLESELRKAAGRFSEVRAEGLRIAGEIRECGYLALQRAATSIVEAWNQGIGASSETTAAIIAAAVEQFAAETARPIVTALTELAHGSAEVLKGTAAGLGLDGAPDSYELSGVLKGMPRLDIGTFDISIRPSRLGSALGSNWTARRVERKLRSQIGDRVLLAFSRHGKQLESWLQRTMTDFQARFDSFADTYRAQLERLTGQKGLAPEEEAVIRRDLTAIELCVTADIP
jgi:hypothetical protein